MFKFVINPWIVTRTYSFNKTMDSIGFIKNLKSGIIYVLKGQAADLWSIIISFPTVEEIYEYADNNNFNKEFRVFLYELESKDIITIQNSNYNINFRHYKYLKDFIILKDSNFSYFLQKLSRLKIKNNILSSISLELNYSCNLRCIHCYNPKYLNNYRITFEIVKKIIDDAYSQGLENVNLTGGECTINSDFLKIAKYIRNKYLSLCILTNGISLFDNEYLFNEVVKLYPSNIQLSLYSMNPDVHDRITGVKGSHFKTLSVIKKLRKKNVNVNIASLTTSYNIEDYKAVSKFAKTINANFTPSCIFIENSANNNITVKLRKDNLKNFYMDTFDINNIRPEFEKNDNLICNGGSSKLCITPNLDIKPCTSFPLIFGNYNDITIKELRKTIIPEFKKIFISKNLKGCFKYKYCKYCYYCLNEIVPEKDYLKKRQSLCEDAKAYYNAYLYHMKNQ